MRLPAVLAVLSLVACGEATPPPARSAQVTVAVARPSQPTTAAPGHALSRSLVHAVVADGLGAFLQRVDIDDQPVMVAGKFHGFRIAALRDPDFWAGVDIQPGDVVTALNGFPIERPEQAQVAFDSLDVASELHLAYERDGKPRDLVYAIVNDR
jgi:type II secretion system protein C